VGYLDVSAATRARLIEIFKAPQPDQPRKIAELEVSPGTGLNRLENLVQLLEWMRQTKRAGQLMPSCLNLPLDRAAQHRSEVAGAIIMDEHF
jgi:hypothetical protein